MTAKEYAANLDENLGDLYERLRTGRYVGPPVERVWIEKDEKSECPIGKPTFEDKIVQRAAVHGRYRGISETDRICAS